jgi:hypothetical protein
MKKKLAFILMTFFVAGTSAFSQTSKDASPCDVIKGKSYIGWQAGSFDGNANTVNSFRIDFDAAGKGTTREFFTLNNKDNAQQVTRTAVCKTANGRTYLEFSDGSTLYITSYDSGTKIWAEAPVVNRKTKGWMLQLPPNPPVSSNVIQ